MAGLIGNYALNLVKLLAGRRMLRPLAAIYHVTERCNLNCVYCEYYGARCSAEHAPLSLAQAKVVLARIREGADRIIFTGGEPLLHPHIEALVRHARDLDFRGVTLLTNGALLADHTALLPLIDRLVVSLDAVAPARWDAVIRSAPGTAQQILDNLRALAPRQSEQDFRIIVNCVITPETLELVEGVIDFCAAHQLALSVSPQARNNWPRSELLTSARYHALIDRLMALKREGFPLLVSGPALHTMRRAIPFKCYPTLFAHVQPDGRLVYPCPPIQRSGTEHGGEPSSLLEVESWGAAVAQAHARFGSPPLICTSCFQQCYVEPSLMQARPLALLWEWLRYPVVRRGELATYSIG